MVVVTSSHRNRAFCRTKSSAYLPALSARRFPHRRWVPRCRRCPDRHLHPASRDVALRRSGLLWSARSRPIPLSLPRCGSRPIGRLLRQGRQFRAASLGEPAGRFPELALRLRDLSQCRPRVSGTENAFQPREGGFFVPSDPERMFDPRPNRPHVIQSADCLVDAQGAMYLTHYNARLDILQFERP